MSREHHGQTVASDVPVAKRGHSPSMLRFLCDAQVRIVSRNPVMRQLSALRKLRTGQDPLSAEAVGRCLCLIKHGRQMLETVRAVIVERWPSLQQERKT